MDPRPLEFTYKDEADIVSEAARAADREVCFYPAQSDLGLRLLDSLRGSTIESRERPDLWDHRTSLLIEAMTIDDHVRSTGKDLTRQREAEVQRELKRSGFAEMFPNAKLSVLTSSGLPTDEDHSYAAYLSHFQKVVSHHARNDAEYRSQLPGADLAYLLLDLSTGYFESLGSFGRDMSGRPHMWFGDAAFIEAIIDSGVDCVAWLAPYKTLELVGEGMFDLPKLVIIDVSLLREGDSVRYDANRLRSTEE